MRLRRLILSSFVATTLAVPAGQSIVAPMYGASTPATCLATALTATVGRGSGAAGTTYETLLLRNHSSGSCALSGTPATQFGHMVVAANTHGPAIFKAVGPVATKLTMAGRGKTIVVRPGAVASVTIGIGTATNYVPTQCRKATASRVRLVFSNGTRLYYKLAATAVCTKLASTTTSGVVLGTRYP
jgi:hypothetical protein